MFEWQKQFLTSERSERENCYHIWTENGSNFRTQYKSIQYLQICKAILFAFYNISQPNFAILLICLVLKLVYKNQK
jgi:hypothetical protein